MQNPFFSIIIPTFNSSSLLGRCLSSILNQSCTNWEILIIDSLSTDNTLEIARNFNDHRIRIYSAADQGIYDAMNKGLKLARGEWLYFLGSDDEFFDSEVLSSIKVKLANKDVGVVYGNVISNRFKGNYDGAFDKYKLYNQNMCHQSIFVHQSVFKLIGNFNLRYERWADYHHNVRWMLNRKVKNLYLDMIVAKYADGGYSSQNVDNYFIERKAKIFIRYGFKSLSHKFLLDIAMNELSLMQKQAEQKITKKLYQAKYQIKRIIKKVLSFLC